MRKTKIICTIGPKTRNLEIIKELIKNGVDVVRINMAHDVKEQNGKFDFSEHSKTIDFVRRASEELGKIVGILQDISGLKVRIGEIKGKKLELKRGDRIVIVNKNIEGEKGKDNKFYLTLNFKQIIGKLKPNQKLLVDDGRLTLEVISVSSDKVECEVLTSHILWEKKGINIPYFSSELPVLTERDEASLLFGIKENVDMIAISFVRNAKDILNVREFLKKNNTDKPIIAKIEKKESIENLDEIVKVADGVMVARGDLGIEIELENLPIYQEKIIQTARRYRKPVIMATQMLYSMIKNDTPTRAEVCDIGNAIKQDCDALMLSDETAGIEAKYPVKAVEWMAKIIEKNETGYISTISGTSPEFTSFDTIISYGLSHIASKGGIIKGLICEEEEIIPKIVASFRTTCPILVFSKNLEILRPLTFIKGIIPIKIEKNISEKKGFLRKLGFDIDNDIFIKVGRDRERKSNFYIQIKRGI